MLHLVIFTEKYQNYAKKLCFSFNQLRRISLYFQDKILAKLAILHQNQQFFTKTVLIKYYFIRKERKNFTLPSFTHKGIVVIFGQNN